jgi:hypothetical protein
MAPAPGDERPLPGGAAAGAVTGEVYHRVAEPDAGQEAYPAGSGNPGGESTGKQQVTEKLRSQQPARRRQPPGNRTQHRQGEHEQRRYQELHTEGGGVLLQDAGLPVPVLVELPPQPPQRPARVVRCRNLRVEIEPKPRGPHPVVELVVLIAHQLRIEEARLAEYFAAIPGETDRIHEPRAGGVAVRRERPANQRVAGRPHDVAHQVVADFDEPAAYRPGLHALERLHYFPHIIRLGKAVRPEDDHDLTPRGTDSVVERARRDALRVIDYPDGRRGVRARQLLHDLPRTVRGTTVRHQQLQAIGRVVLLQEALQASGNRPLLIAGRDDDANQGLRRGIRRFRIVACRRSRHSCLNIEPRQRRPC